MCLDMYMYAPEKQCERERKRERVSETDRVRSHSIIGFHAVVAVHNGYVSSGIEKRVKNKSLFVLESVVYNNYSQVLHCCIFSSVISMACVCVCVRARHDA